MPEEHITNNIRSREVTEILTRVPNWMIRWGNSLFLFLIILFFSLAYLIQYPDVISATGIITTYNPPQKVYAKLTGKIDTILVEDTQVVQEGSILAMIENSAQLEDVKQLKTIIKNLNTDRDSLFYPINEVPIFTLGNIAPAYSNFEKAYIDFSLNSDLSPFGNKVAANELLLSGLNSKLDRLEKQREISIKSLNLTEKDLARNRTLFNKGVISQQQYETKQLEFLSKERDMENVEANVSQLKQSISETTKQFDEIRINSKMENTRLYKNLILSLNQLNLAIRDWELQYLLQSDIMGAVSFINILNKNQTVENGELLFTVIPKDESDYIAKIEAPVANSGKIKKGQRVNISLLNFPETEYGSISGTIESMSALPNSTGRYLINVDLVEGLKTSYDIEIPFKSEMTGRAEIITEDLRLIERLFYQLKNMFPF